MNRVKKDDIDNPAMPSWYAAEVKRNRQFYRWFWLGFFVAVPVSFILGHGQHIGWLIGQYSLLYIFILIIGWLIVGKLNGIKFGAPLELRLQNPIAKTFFTYSNNSVALVGGHALGFLTFNLIFRNIY